MFRRLMTSPPRSLEAWLAYALILVTPGSFIVVPVLWLALRLRKGGVPDRARMTHDGSR